ncbi:helix-turn-helix transcriptional regulator [Sphaerochaeta sp.]|uniref:helix-turn-helix transcriptional regulator n=1 Tax=Sphaerochaeta sp. TaxID=1972642 RepID=UPI00258EFBB2|nr:helix-turn-helix transcriptional regulator [Sphaerochaeta sp.]MDD3457520.1 helix-turn-helix transcriptional regulator [Sphaerochaeta sp.]
MELIAFWLNIAGFSLLFSTFFLTYVSRKSNRHIMFDQYLWYIALTWIWYLFQFIGFVYQTMLERNNQTILLVITIVRYVFTILMFHRIPLFLDSIITGQITEFSAKASKVIGFTTFLLVIFLVMIGSPAVGPYVSAALNALVGTGFLYTLMQIKGQKTFSATRMRSFLVISSIAYLLFSLYTIIFSIANTRHQPAFDATVTALYIIAWCINDAMVYLRELSSLGTRDSNPIATFQKQYKLSEREQQIVRLLVDGKSYKEIAYELSLSPRTVETHVYRIFKKCSVSTKLELINKMYPLRTTT